MQIILKWWRKNIGYDLISKTNIFEICSIYDVRVRARPELALEPLPTEDFPIFSCVFSKPMLFSFHIFSSVCWHHLPILRKPLCISRPLHKPIFPAAFVHHILCAVHTISLLLAVVKFAFVTGLVFIFYDAFSME